ARAYIKLKQWQKAEADYDKALELKPADAELRLERGQFFMDRGQQDRALKEFAKALEPRTRELESPPTNLPNNPEDGKGRADLSQAYLALGETQRKSRQPAAAIATALERGKLWAGYFGEAYDQACELAQCVPLAGEKGPERQKYADQAMDALRK